MSSESNSKFRMVEIIREKLNVPYIFWSKPLGCE